MAEWSIASDLKSDEVKASGSSNLPLSVLNNSFSDKRDRLLKPSVLADGEFSMVSYCVPARIPQCRCWIRFGANPPNPSIYCSTMQIRRHLSNSAITVDTCQYRVPLPQEKPQHILEEIVWHKEVEVDRMREGLSLKDLSRRLPTAPPVRDFIAALRSGNTQPALIAEVKKASPSKGVIREDFDPVAIAESYQKGGASCLSVLTDRKFFQGSFDYLQAVRERVELPILCKEFIIYPYQIYLARSRGADAVLLIASILSDRDLQYFIKITKTLGMAALIEVHTLEEFDRVLSLDGVTLVGINNRNLEDFSVDLATTCNILQEHRTILEERDILLVSESGLHVPEDLERVKTAGANAVLIGESLVKQPDPAAAITTLFANCTREHRF